MNTDCLYRDPEYSWDQYIKAYKVEDVRRTGKGCLKI